MIRIYCDWNNGIDGQKFDLGCHGSVQDLNLHASALKDGMRVVLDQTDELEMEGTIHFDEDRNRWWAIPDVSTKRFIGRSAVFERNA